MDFVTDLRYALRLLRKTPVFTIAAIGTLALGIGANTTIFSLVQTVLLHPLPYQDPDQVVMVWEDATFAGFPRNTPAPGNFNDWRASNRSFADMAATRFAGASLTMDGSPELVLGRGVTPNFFDVLGVRPLLGRSFAPADDRAGVNVVVISHALWQRRYGGDRGVIGRTMVMNDVKFEVIGVAPESFVFINREVDYWVAIQLPPAQVDTRRSHFLNVVARLKPGVSVQAADGEMRAMAKRMEAQYPDTNRNVGAVVVPIREQVLGDTRVEVIALAVAAMAIVLIACANLASLLLARASVRRGEYCGASVARCDASAVARQVLIEALVSVGGGRRARPGDSTLTSTLIERIVPAGLQGLNVSVLDWRLLCSRLALDRDRRALQLGPAVQSAHASTAEVLQQHARGNIGGSARRFRDASRRAAGGGDAGAARRRRPDAEDARQPQRHRVGIQRRQSAHDAGGTAAGEVCRTGHAYGVFRSRGERGASASRRSRGGVCLDAPISSDGQHAVLCHRGPAAFARRCARCALSCRNGRLPAHARRVADRGPAARRARWRRCATLRRRQRDAGPAVHAGAVGAWTPNQIRRSH